MNIFIVKLLHAVIGMKVGAHIVHGLTLTLETYLLYSGWSLYPRSTQSRIQQLQAEDKCDDNGTFSPTSSH